MTGQEFVRGFLQHVLPKHFQKVRYYGWMSPNSRTHWEEVRWLVYLYLGWVFWLRTQQIHESERDTGRLRCSACGGKLSVIRVLNFDCRSFISHPLIEHGLAYLDSG